MALLEREGFLADLSSLILEAATGEGRLLFLGGEAGIGKSELLRAFRTEPTVHDLGAEFLLGACDSLSTPRPLGPLLDMAGVGGFGLGRNDIGSKPRYEIFETFLERLTGSKVPSIVVFEDMHWADEATLDLLRFLGRRLQGAKVLLISSYRDDEVGPTHPLRILMGDLATTRSYRRMQLPRLSLTAVEKLAAESEIDSEELFRRTGGNPFYVTEVLSAGEGGIPTRISDAVLARASRLSPESRAVLDVCSVIGFRFEPQLVSDVMVPGVDTTAAFEQCTQAGVLVVDDQAMAFRHELARDALLAAVGFVRKRALHGLILEVLVANGSTDDSSLAHHAEGALDAAAVLEFAPAAGRAAAKSGSHREAAAQFSRALRFASGLAPQARAELLEAYAAEHVLTDQPVQVDEAYREAIALRKELGDDRGRVLDMVRLSQNLMRQGRNRESDDIADQALHLLQSMPPGKEHAFVRVNRAFLKMLDRHNAEAIVDGERAIALAREFNDVDSLMLAYNVVGSSQILLGMYEEGRANLLRTLRLGQRFARDNAVGGAYGNLGSGFGEMYRIGEAEGFLRAGIDFARKRDLDFQANYMEAWLATVLLFRAEWDEAVVLAAAVLRRSGGSAITRIMALVVLGRVRARRGDPDVWIALDEADELAAKTGTLQRIGPVRAARAEAAFLAGDYARAAKEAGSAYELAIHHEHPWHTGELSYWQRMAVAAEKSAGSLVAPARSGRPTRAAEIEAEPYALEAAGDWAAAAAAWQGLGCPYETARALSAAQDEEPLERARATFERLGAAPALATAEAKMRALGHRVPRGPAATTAANPANLTRREAQILTLLAEGKTNQEIAGDLFRSVRTVDHHVSAILAKLEVSNRVEATRRAGELGLFD